MFNDPNSSSPRLSRDDSSMAYVASTDEDSICIAAVDDGEIAAASVMDEKGNFNLALPENYETTFTIECIKSNKLTGEEYNDANDKKQTTHRAFTSTQYKPPPICDRKHFQPGYYDQRTYTWHDHCTGRLSNTADGSLKKESILSKKNCPVVDNDHNRKKDVWVSFIGDSVTRQLWLEGFKESGINLLPRGPAHAREWRNGRMQGKRHPDFSLRGIGENSESNKIWLSYTLDFLTEDKTSNWDLPYTWGDFMRERGEGPRSDDPLWPIERPPDIVFFSPGYHASYLNARAYGEGVENVLNKWQGIMAEYNVPMPKMHLVLNMMPAPWLIPDKYDWDRPLRTRAREYQKNLSIIAAAKKYDFVESVVDFFSIELPFNGYPGKTSHRDAVHFDDKRVLRIIGDRAIDTLCYS